MSFAIPLLFRLNLVSPSQANIIVIEDTTTVTINARATAKTVPVKIYPKFEILTCNKVQNYNSLEFYFVNISKLFMYKLYSS